MEGNEKEEGREEKQIMPRHECEDLPKTFKMENFHELYHMTAHMNTYCTASIYIPIGILLVHVFGEH